MVELKARNWTYESISSLDSRGTMGLLGNRRIAKQVKEAVCPRRADCYQLFWLIALIVHFIPGTVLTAGIFILQDAGMMDGLIDVKSTVALLLAWEFILLAGLTAMILRRRS